MPSATCRPLVCCLLLLSPTTLALGVGRTLSSRAQGLLANFITGKASCPSGLDESGGPLDKLIIKLNALAESAVAGTNWTAAENFVRELDSTVDSDYISYVVEFASANFPVVALDMGEASLEYLLSFHDLEQYIGSIVPDCAVAVGDPPIGGVGGRVEFEQGQMLIPAQFAGDYAAANSGGSSSSGRRLSESEFMPTNTSVFINITCTLIGFSLETNNGTLNTLCTDNGTQYPLAGDQATRQWIDQFEWGMKLATTLTPQNEEGGVVYSIIDANLVPGPPPMNSVATIQGSGRYFSGERRIRLLSVLVEVNGLWPEYAGSTRAEREAWAIDQRRFMDESWRFGTFGKLGFDEEASRVVTVDLGTVDTSQQNCFWRLFEFAKAASAQVAPAMTPLTPGSP